MRVLARRKVHLCAAILLAALTPGIALADLAREDAYARAFLDILQERTLSTGREYCGYFGYDAEGRIVATPARRGRIASCLPPVPPVDMDVFASFHTHGSFNRNYFNETPSSDDIITDRAEGIIGYVSTPGGRIWRVDGPGAFAEQVCGLACVHSDPNFVPGSDGDIPDTLTLREIRRREGG
ncbi:MAG: DUF4329 domain-containing protein [Pseudomonadota bacterium]